MASSAAATTTVVAASPSTLHGDHSPPPLAPASNPDYVARAAFTDDEAACKIVRGRIHKLALAGAASGRARKAKQQHGSAAAAAAATAGAPSEVVLGPVPLQLDLGTSPGESLESAAVVEDVGVDEDAFVGQPLMAPSMTHDDLVRDFPVLKYVTYPAKVVSHRSPSFPSAKARLRRLRTHASQTPQQLHDEIMARWFEDDGNGACAFRRAPCAEPNHVEPNRLTSTWHVLLRQPLCTSCVERGAKYNLMTGYFAENKLKITKAELADLPSAELTSIVTYGSKVKNVRVYMVVDVARVLAGRPLPASAPAYVESPTGISGHYIPTDNVNALTTFYDMKNVERWGVLGGGYEALAHSSVPRIARVRVGREMHDVLLGGSETQRRHFRVLQQENFARVARGEPPRALRLRTVLACSECNATGSQSSFPAFHEEGTSQLCSGCAFALCTGCGERLRAKRFDPVQWAARRNPDVTAALKCLACATETFPCRGCGEPTPRYLFERKAWTRRVENPPLCFSCVISATCSECGTQRAKEEYSPRQWKRLQRRAPHDARVKRLKCLECEAAHRHRCRVCGEARPRAHFTAAAWRNRMSRPPRCVECSTTTAHAPASGAWADEAGTPQGASA